MSGIQIPYEQLSEDALLGVIEEFVTRDGTELTDAEKKVAQVMAHLERGLLEIWFDEGTGTCNLQRAPES